MGDNILRIFKIGSFIALITIMYEILFSRIPLGILDELMFFLLYIFIIIPAHILKYISFFETTGIIRVKGMEFPQLTLLSAFIFYGGLLTLAYIISFLVKKLKKKK